jgi:hypothetical protein
MLIRFSLQTISIHHNIVNLNIDISIQSSYRMVKCQNRKSKIKCPGERARAVNEDVYKYTHCARFLAITFIFTKNMQINTVPSSQSTLITPQISPLMIQDSYESSDKMKLWSHQNCCNWFYHQIIFFLARNI